ncbi:MAG TPA: hypothetical protein VGR60_07450 [Gemmatimonadales bacterium]|nr:hypothetical protein [Gemmatimonadales bacterium]
MRRSLLCLALTAAPLAAQMPASTPPELADSLVLDHQFQAGADDRAPLALEAGTVYRAEADRADIQLEVVPVPPGHHAPYVTATARGVSETDQITFEIYPMTSGQVEIRVLGGAPGAVTHLQVYLDRRRSQSRRLAAEGPGWTGGLEIRLGFHDPYRQGLSTVAGGGLVLDACANFRPGPEVRNRLSGCIIGIEYQSGVSPFQSTKLFIEPRLHLWGGPSAAGMSGNEVGLLGRVAFGLGSSRPGDSLGTKSSSYYGVGAYLAHDIAPDAIGTGWQLQLVAMHAFAAGGGSDWSGADLVSVGIARYF